MYFELVALAGGVGAMQLAIIQIRLFLVWIPNLGTHQITQRTYLEAFDSAATR